MRELTMMEVEQAGGGIGILGALIIGVVGSIIGSYATEKVGGAAGIEKAASDTWDAYVDGFAQQADYCQKLGTGCDTGVM